MKILITGCAGFIGFHLTKRLVELGHHVTGLDCLNDFYPVSLKHDRLLQLGIDDHGHSHTHQNLSFIRLDMNEKASLQTLFEEKQFDMVCHLAALTGISNSVKHPEDYLHSNINGFFHLIECCQKFQIKHLVYMSSSSVYGASTTTPFTTTTTSDQPLNFYAASKKTNELFAHSYSHLHQLPTTGLRLFTVYGPWGRPDMAPFKFAENILKGEEITVYHEGKVARDFTYVDDVIASIEAVLFQPPSGKMPYQIYNIGRGEPTEVIQLVRTIEELTNKKAKINFQPLPDSDMLSTSADIKPMVRDYALKPEFNIKLGMKEFIHWFREYYRL